MGFLKTSLQPKQKSLQSAAPSGHLILSTANKVQVSAGLSLVVIGIIVLVGGWVLGIEMLKQLCPGFPTMKANTAIGFLLAGNSLLLWRKSTPLRRSTAVTLGALVALLGTINIIQYVSGINFGIDELFFRDYISPFTSDPGRMSPNTSLNFLLTGIALVLLSTSFAEWFAMAAFLPIIISLSGYFHGAEHSIGLFALTGMAAHTVIAFLILIAGILTTSPSSRIVLWLTSRGPEGTVVRRLLPAGLIVIFLTELITQKGLSIGFYEDNYRDALNLFINLLALSVCILGVTRSLARVDKERKQIHEALQKAHDELEIRVQERTAKLREMDEILLKQSRHATMGEMTSNIAHQWRQPLNSLGLMLQLLPMKYETKKFDLSYLQSTVESAMKTIQHMSQTIDDFRCIFKPDKEKETFNIDASLNKTIGLIEESFKELNINIDIYSQKEITIEGYPNEFAQALLNILQNARDILIEKQIKKPRIIVTLNKENDKAVLTIADNAGGIPEDFIDKVFDPYFSTKGPEQGTGIGLFMCKAIIEKNMGGKLTVKNSDLGAEFKIEV